MKTLTEKVGWELKKNFIYIIFSANDIDESENDKIKSSF